MDTNQSSPPPSGAPTPRDSSTSLVNHPGSHHHFHKIILVLVLLLVIVGTVTTFIVTSQKPHSVQIQSKTAMTTVTPLPTLNPIDTVMSYTVPSGFRKSYDQHPNTITLTSPDFKVGTDSLILSGEQITIGQSKKDPNYSLAKFLKGPLDPRIQNVKETTVGGYDAVSSETNTFTDIYHYQVIKDNYQYYILISLPVNTGTPSGSVNPLLEKYQSINNAFINSIKFK